MAGVVEDQDGTMVMAVAGQAELGAAWHILLRPADVASGKKFAALFLGLLVWFRALQIPLNLGDTYVIARRFQLGVLLLVALALTITRHPVFMNDLIFAYFALGTLAVALTRMEAVAQVEASNAAPLGPRWSSILALTLLVGGLGVALAARVFTVDLTRWLLLLIIIPLQIFIVIVALLIAVLLTPLMALLRRLMG
ncbi:MAG: hypothetical protein GY824_31750, partial [Delftia sp.]|nr:hypothetical protein [Delftia sp.]